MFPSGGHSAWQLIRRGPDLDKQQKLAPGTIRRAMGLAAKYRVAIASFLVITVGSAFLGAVPPLLMRALIDKALERRDSGMLNLLAGAAVLVALAIAGAGLLSRWLSARIGEGLIYDLRVKLFDHVQRMPLAFFTRTQTGALISRLNSDVVGAQQAMTGTLGTIVQNTITVATTVIIMLLLEWRLALLALSLLPAFMVPAKRVGRRVQSITREQMGHNAAMNATMQERFNVAGAMLAKLFGRPREETELFAGRAQHVRDIGVRLAIYMRTLFVALGLVAAVGSAAVYWVGGRFAIDEVITPGTVIAFVAYVSQLYGPLTMLTNARVDLMSSFVSFERVFEVLDLPPAIDDAADAAEMRECVGAIEFRDVWFRYPRAEDVSLASLETVGTFGGDEERPEVLRGVAFAVEPGSTVALVGPSGGGKTTITNLIPRLYDATTGMVLIDGRDVRTVTQESLRSHMAVVPQDPHMFHDTIAANLRFARPEATDEDLVRACEAAQIHRLIASLPEGYETVVGERGYRLSGGEKQRLAIARVLLKAPAIVILDEATAHLDSESEVLIQRALRAALEGRTSMVIAHRLSTIVEADEILVIDEGKVVQRGRHADLIRERGLYADLYETQFLRAGAP